MTQYVIIRNNRSGLEKKVSADSFRLMPKSVLKAWTKVGTAKEEKGTTAPMKPTASTYIPDEIVEKRMREDEAARVKADTALITGVAEQPAEQAQEAAPVQEEAQAEAQAQQDAPPAEQRSAPVNTEKADDLAAIPNMGKAAAEALAKAGIITFEQLANADNAVLMKALDDAKLTPKKAQVPNWRSKAKELAAA